MTAPQPHQRRVPRETPIDVPQLVKPPPKTQRHAALYRVTEYGWTAEKAAEAMRRQFPDVTADHVMAWMSDIGAGCEGPIRERKNKRWPVRLRSEAIRRVKAGETAYRVAQEIGAYPALVHSWCRSEGLSLSRQSNRERFTAAIAAARRENNLPPLPAEEASVLWRAATDE